MEKSASIETVGFISKEEALQTLNESIIPGTFVIENRDPFPGYNGKDLPGVATVPQFVFFVTKKKYSSEKIIRTAGKIHKYFTHFFDAAPAEINIYNQGFSCIRIKGLQSMEQIAELQSCFADEDIVFARKQKVSGMGIIRVQKIIRIQEQENGIYADLDGQNSFYFEIPTHLNWKLFYKITMNVKNNMGNSNFDAATGGIFRKGGLTEFVRIYDNKPSPERLNEIKDKYIEEVTKFV